MLNVSQKYDFALLEDDTTLYTLLVATRAFYQPCRNTVCVYANPKTQRMTPFEARSFVSLQGKVWAMSGSAIRGSGGTEELQKRYFAQNCPSFGDYFVTEYAKKIQF